MTTPRQTGRDDELRALGFDPTRAVDPRDVEILLSSQAEEQPAVVRALLGYRHADQLTVGSLAPGLVLHRVHDGAALPLARLHTERPLVLFFGSYSCPPFRRRAHELQSVFDDFELRAAFALVYIAEAHASDGWVGKSNREEHILIEQHTTLAERRAAARRFVGEIGLTIPTLVDGMDDAASTAFSAWPERIYILSKGGRIAYQGGRGPYDVRPEEARQALEQLLVAAV